MLLGRERARNLGAFFTPQAMAALLVEPFRLELGSAAGRVLDPACGAGDLLLAFKNVISGDRQKFFEFEGRDVEPEFLAIGKNRFDEACSGLELSERSSVKFKVQDFFSDDSKIAADYVILNPPFFSWIVDECEWATGAVNSAAVFLEKCISRSPHGTKIAAILPDVLRSGSRYGRWRSLVGGRCRIVDIKTVGRFSSEADVDVFMVWLIVGEEGGVGWDKLQTSENQRTVSDVALISVGSVVDYRSPKLGPWCRYLRTVDLSSDLVDVSLFKKRRFEGRCVPPPFVAVRRNSRPDDRFRAKSSIVFGDEVVAVENHVIVVRPVDATMQSCVDIRDALMSETSSDWLNERIRCRHLTVSALRQMPLSM